MAVLARIAALVCLAPLSASCFSPSIADGTVACDMGASNTCPPGFECRADNFCYRPGSAGGEDGGTDPDGAVGGPSGELDWAAAAGGSSYERGIDVAVGSSVVAVGLFSSAGFDFGGTGMDAQSSDDGYVADLDLADGSQQNLFAISGVASDAARAVVTDASGNVFVGGSFGLTVVFREGAEYTKTAMGPGDAFVAKYDSSGILQWVVAFSGAGDNSVEALALGSGGTIYAVGSYSGSIDFLDGTDVAAIGSEEGFLVALDGADGSTDWSRPIPSNGRSRAFAVAATATGLFVAGEYETDLFPGTGDALAAGLGTDAFAVAYSATGALQWTKGFGGDGDDQARAIAIRGGTQLLLGGSAATGTTFDPLMHPAFSNDLGDGFLAALDPNTGVPQVLRTFRSSATNTVTGIATSDLDIAVTGEFGGSVDFGDGTPQAATATDLFIALYPGLGGAPTWSRTFGDAGNEIGGRVAISGSRVVATGSFRDFIVLGDASFTVVGTAPDVFVVSIWK